MFKRILLYLSDRAYVKRKSAPIMKRSRDGYVYFWATNVVAQDVLENYFAQMMAQQPYAVRRCRFKGMAVKEHYDRTVHDAFTRAGLPVALEGKGIMGGNMILIDT